jgi:hypothetical protein
MAKVRARLSNVKIGDNYEATVQFLEEVGLTTDVKVFLPPVDRSLSEIEKEAIAKATAFLRRVIEA